MLIYQYNLYKNGKYLGKFISSEIENLTGCNRNSIGQYADSGHAYKKEYVFEYAENIDIKDNSTEFIKIWKEVMQCARLISSGQAVIRQIGNQKYTCRRINK